MIQIGEGFRCRGGVVHRLEMVFSLPNGERGLIPACDVRRRPESACTAAGPDDGPKCRKQRCWPVGTPYGLVGGK